MSSGWRGGFIQLWVAIQQAQRSTGCREVVCGLEPTGRYHQAVATFLETQGVDFVLISSSVAYWNRRNHDGTWDKNDPKDAMNCVGLLGPGAVLLATHRPVGRTPGPGEAAVPRPPARPHPGAGCRSAALAPGAERLPAYAPLRTIPGIGPTVGAILVAEIGDVAWYTKSSELRKLAGLDIVRVQAGKYAGQRRISKCGWSLLCWACYHAAVGLVRTGAGQRRVAAAKANWRGNRFGGFKAMVELAAKRLRLAWGVSRSGQPHNPTRAAGTRQPRR